MTTTTPKKGDLLKGFLDLVILVLLLASAGLGGYFWGLNERLAPVREVPAGTPGAVSQALSKTPFFPKTEDGKPAAQANTSTPSGTSSSSSPSQSTQNNGQGKYWITSNGVDYIGYSITVKVNDEAVDSFFGPGKSVDVTRFVKKGDNTISFEAKALGEGYNKHAHDEESRLTVKLVSGPSIQENYKSSDVLLSYTRNANEEGDFNDVKHFKVN